MIAPLPHSPFGDIRRDLAAIMPMVGRRTECIGLYPIARCTPPRSGVLAELESLKRK
ncbi:hypothetical protein [Sphingomonas jaspsi]|uniref:hypothetical protein n=1 Tax=Sphingomonas jaspsi TaxID=392409 RepID=UPI0004B12C7F|nr:hypothetical protein [Sphingomonas jaspsi]